MEFTLLAAALTGVLFAWVATRVSRMRAPERPMDALIGAAAVGMLTGRLAAMIADGVNPLTSLTEMLIVRAGVDTVTASIGATAALLWTGRDRLPAFVDNLAPAVLAGLAGWHAGCVWRGTCLGVAADVPWGWSQPGSPITRHPYSIYIAVLLLAAAWVTSRTRTPWRASGLAVMSLGLARLLVEPVRPSLDGGPVWFYAAAAVAGLALAGSTVKRRT